MPSLQKYVDDMPEGAPRFAFTIFEPAGQP
jgi:hypothetical protein